MKKIIISASIGLIVGVLITGTAIYFIQKEKPVTGVNIKQISGEKIIHTEYKFKGKNIKFKTKAEGEGVIVTEIPKYNIPEVDNWNNRVHGLGINAGMFYDGRLTYLVGPVYEYRFKNVSFNVSVMMGKAQTGYSVQGIIGVKYWFKF